MKKDLSFCSIDELCHVEYGTRVVKKRDAGTIYPVYGGGGATFFMDEFNREDQFIISRFGMSEKCTRFVEGKFFLNDSGLTLKPKDENILNQRYLDYQCMSLNDLFFSLGKGSAQKNLHIDSFKKVILACHPLPLQKQIVEKLDAAFADIDKAISATEKNIENAEAFRQKTIDELTTVKHTSNTTISKEIDMLPGYAFKSAQYVDDEDGITLLRGDNLKPNAIDFTEAKKYPKESIKEYEKFHLQENDIVIGMDRPWISSGLRTAMIKKADLPCLLVQRVMRMRCPTTINPNFFYLHLQTSSFLSHILGKETGLGVPHISGKTIGSFEFFLPELKKQNEIVYIFLSLDSNIHKLKKSYISKLRNYEALKSSILNQAFSGELTKDVA